MDFLKSEFLQRLKGNETAHKMLYVLSVSMIVHTIKKGGRC